MKIGNKEFVKGFTLIELLVVIAIVGILSTVVLGSLGTSRSKAANANIKSSLSNARAQAELFYDTNGSLGYTGACGSANSSGGAGSIRKFIDAAHAVSPATSVLYGYSDAQTNTTRSVCHANASVWVISVPLKYPETSGATTYYYYCVDSTGASSNKISPLPGSQGACPAT